MSSQAVKSVPVTGELVQNALDALNRYKVKTRDTGTCHTCGKRTLSGMDKLCDRCALAVLYEATREMRL